MPFDLGVGTGADGRTVVTYSRCRREPSYAPSPDFSAASGCRLFAYDVQRRRERVVRGASRRFSARYLPRIAGHTLIFAARPRRLRDGPPQLYRLDLRKPGEVRQLAGGTKGDDGPDGDIEDIGPVDIDFDGRGLTYRWSYQAFCPPGGDVGQPVEREEIWLRTSDGSQRRVRSGGCFGDGADLLASPALTPSRVSWLEIDFDPADGGPERRVGVQARAIARQVQVAAVAPTAVAARPLAHGWLTETQSTFDPRTGFYRTALTRTSLKFSPRAGR